MKKLNRHFELDAGHRLAEHEFKCQNLHGHRYKFDIEIKGSVDEETGMLMDFSHVKSPIMDAFDHNCLLNSEDELVSEDLVEQVNSSQNKELYLMDCEPSAENIVDESAELIFEKMSLDEKNRINSVLIELYETPNCKVKASYIIDKEDGPLKLKTMKNNLVDSVKYDE